MARMGTISLVLALVLFLIFFTNVLAGALRWGELFGDVSQLVLMLAASVAFVVGILCKEADEKSRNNPTVPQ